MKPQSKYSEKLRDPRWQKKRLEIMERDTFSCQRCGDTKSTLNVHHLWYEPKTEPWDYNEECFITLCEDCHTEETECRKNEESVLLDTVRRARFLAGDVNAIAYAFAIMQSRRPSDTTAAIIAWAFENFQLLDEMYFKSLADARKEREAKNG